MRSVPVKLFLPYGPNRSAGVLSNHWRIKSPKLASVLESSTLTPDVDSIQVSQVKNSETPKMSKLNDLTESDKHYFDSYDHFGIHEEMLKDEVRTISYRDSMYHNRHLLKDKIVLDVGCGSGILSMFAARAGAKHVIGVDRSNIINMARQVVAMNGLSDKITLIQGKMEEIELPFPEVDIIVSEWMGYFLLYEAMLDTVLYARDRYLKKGGLILPDKASLYIAAIEDSEYKNDKIGFWKNVYGFDYSPFEATALEEPLVDVVDLKAVVSDPCKIIELDILTVTKEDLSFTRSFNVVSRRDDMVHGFVVWFDIEFSHLTKPIRFSTGPMAKYTHWKQTVFYTVEDFHIRQGDTITGELAIKPSELNPRDINIDLDYALKRNSDVEPKFKHCKYTMR